MSQLTQREKEFLAKRIKPWLDMYGFGNKHSLSTFLGETAEGLYRTTKHWPASVHNKIFHGGCYDGDN